MMQPRKSRTDGAELGRTASDAAAGALRLRPSRSVPFRLGLVAPNIPIANRNPPHPAWGGGGARGAAGGEKGGAGRGAEAAGNARGQGFEAPPAPHAAPRTATTNASPGSKVRRSPVTSGPTPSR